MPRRNVRRPASKSFFPYNRLMPSNDLQPVADAVLRLAKRQGFVTARDVRSELRIAGLPEATWKT